MLQGEPEALERAVASASLELAGDDRAAATEHAEDEIGSVEAIVGPTSLLVGQSAGAPHAVRPLRGQPGRSEPQQPAHHRAVARRRPGSRGRALAARQPRATARPAERVRLPAAGEARHPVGQRPQRARTGRRAGDRDDADRPCDRAGRRRVLRRGRRHGTAGRAQPARGLRGGRMADPGDAGGADPGQCCHPDDRRHRTHRRLAGGSRPRPCRRPASWP